jgi:excisionase family DNA binding protein
MNTENRLLTPQEVALRFRVDLKTVSRWAKSGKLPGIKTPGNHWRFFENDVNDLLEGKEG